MSEERTDNSDVSPRTVRELQGRQEAKQNRLMLQRQMIRRILRQDIDDETKVEMLMEFMELPVTAMIELWIAVHEAKRV